MSNRDQRVGTSHSDIVICELTNAFTSVFGGVEQNGSGSVRQLKSGYDWTSTHNMNERCKLE